MVWGASEVIEVLDWLASWNQRDDPAAVAVGLVQLRSQYFTVVHHDGKEANELKDCGGVHDVVVAGDRQNQTTTDEVSLHGEHCGLVRNWATDTVFTRK